MGAFTIERLVAAPSSQVWDVVTDWAGYSRWIPLTTMRLDPGQPRVGWSFTGVTGLGPLSFSDRMRITSWSPPSETSRTSSFRVVKVGRLLAGWAEVSVLADPDGEHATLHWREEILVRPVLLGRFVAPLTDRVNRALFARVLDAMADEAVRAGGRR